MRHAAVFCAVTLGVSCGASATQLGLASFYGVGGLTAAHRSLPMGSRVRVLNLDNGRSVVVRIVDRGPFIRGRIIDVSTAAAVTLGFREAGLARVRIDPIPAEAPEAAPRPERQAPSAPMDISYAICRYGADRLQHLQSDSLGGEAVAATRDMGCETSRSRLFDLAQRSEDLAGLASHRVADLTEAEAAASIPVNAIAEMEAAASIPVSALPPVPERQASLTGPPRGLRGRGVLRKPR